MNSNIPSGWHICTISDVAKVNPSKIIAEPDLVAGFVPMSLAPTDFNGQLQFEEKAWGEIQKSYTNFQNGDVIFAKVTPCFENGKAAIVDDLPNGIGAGSSEFYVLRPEQGAISNRLLFALLKTNTFAQNGAENMTGAVGLRRVPRAFVEGFEFPLPPLAEQKVIADKLDTLLTQVETTKARLDRIPEILKSFRQSVLSAAVSGKLIEITDDDLTECFLSDVSCFQNGYAFKSDWFSDRGDYQVIKLGNVKDDYLKLDAAPAFLSNELASDYIKFKPDIGDILLSMTGTKFKRDYGFACVVNKELPILINQRVGRIIPDKDKVSPGFLHLFLRSDAFRDQFFEGETGGVNQGNVGSKHIMMCKLSLPNLGNQSQITEKARLLLDYADTVETQVNNALARVNNLTQSILGKAFRGELTADWRAANPELISGDNSAAALLDKIKAERALLNKKKRG